VSGLVFFLARDLGIRGGPLLPGSSLQSTGKCVEPLELVLFLRGRSP
jgi:hypothetical protein